MLSGFYLGAFCVLSRCLYHARHAGVHDAYTVEGISRWPQCPKHDVHGNVIVLHVVNGIVTTWVIADLLTADCNGVSWLRNHCSRKGVCRFDVHETVIVTDLV